MQDNFKALASIRRERVRGYWKSKNTVIPKALADPKALLHALTHNAGNRGKIIKNAFAFRF